jgi:hypothetical protein
MKNPPLPMFFFAEPASAIVSRQTELYGSNKCSKVEASSV